MIKIENISVYNIARAVYSSRNALNSWDKSDSDLEHDILGENDLDLARRLYKAGAEHRKYMRQIFVTMDVTAPRYWWEQQSTYKIGTTSNSCSTMHTIHKKPFELDDFSHEHLVGKSIDVLKSLIDVMNVERSNYLYAKDKDCWWQMIQLLPSSYNQRRTVTMTYENVMAIIKQRTGHKLDEWNQFVALVEQLPYVKEIMNADEI